MAGRGRPCGNRIRAGPLVKCNFLCTIRRTIPSAEIFMNIIWIWAGVGALLLATLLAYWRRGQRGATSSNGDRYAAKALLTPAQAELMAYLQTAFPNQPVLAQVPLDKIVSVRRAASESRANARLASFEADFVVCDENCKAAFVFDVEAYRAGDARSAQQESLVKNRILKSAGIRLIYIKESSRKMPSPNDFRLKLSLAALVSRSEAKDTARQQLEQRMASRVHEHQPSEFRESEVMGMSGLMGLHGRPGDEADPWGRRD